MPQFVSFFAVIALPLSVFSQSKNATSFGKIDKADLQITSCSYDKDASAEVISNTGEFSLDFINGVAIQTLHRTVKIKIFSDKGLEQADIKLPYHDKVREQISNISATTHNLDDAGNIVSTKLEKNLIYDKKITSYRSEKIFTMPNVKSGSVIEYKYTINNSFRRTWYLQQNGRLSCRITLDYKRPYYTTAEYPVLKEFYKKMYSLLDEQFVIKKKA